MRFARVAIEARDPERIAAFLERALGIPREGASLQAGATRLDLLAGEPRGVYHLAFNIPEDQIQAGRAWLLDRGVDLLRGDDGADVFHFASWNAHAVYFRDPEENLWELIARHDLPTATGAPFSPASILRVGEIGRAARDVLATARDVCAATRAPIWQGPHPEFTKVGDQEGLILVAAEGRKWFSAETPARPTRASLTLEDGRVVAWDATP